MTRDIYNKRVLRDIDLLKTNYDIHIDENDKTIIYIMDHEKYYQMDILLNFPFHCPRLYCINRETNSRLLYYSLYGSWVHFYRKKMNDDSICLCCNNLNYNWSPKHRMSDIIKEARTFYEYFKNVRSFYFGRKLLMKINYLNNDVMKYILDYLSDGY